MHLSISEHVKDFIRKKGGIVTIDLFEPVNCCAAGPDITTSFQKPKKLQNYKQYEKDGICFFISKQIILTAHSLELTLKGFGLFKFLHVHGYQPFREQVR